MTLREDFNECEWVFTAVSSDLSATVSPLNSTHPEVRMKENMKPWNIVLREWEKKRNKEGERIALSWTYLLYNITKRNATKKLVVFSGTQLVGLRTIAFEILNCSNVLMKILHSYFTIL